MTIERTFTPRPESVTSARRFVVGALADLPRGPRDAVGLIVSELATNAVLYAGTDFEVSVDRGAETLTIRVTDRGGGTPAALDWPPLDRLHGRGLLIVSELSDEWGTTPATGGIGKTVWARLTLDPHPAAAQRSGSSGRVV